MHLQEHYNNLYERSIADIRNGTHQTDSWIDAPNDNRRGLTLLIRPSTAIQHAINQFQQELMLIDDQQYYQPISDMHITVLSVISCSEYFDLDQIDLSAYIRLIEKSAQHISDIQLRFEGISTSPEAVLVQGFPINDRLEQFRKLLRKDFKTSGLYQTIDARYTLSTAHITTVRFRKKLRMSEKYADVLQHHRNTEFGSFQPTAIELVYNDWYQRGDVVETLHTFLV